MFFSYTEGTYHKSYRPVNLSTWSIKLYQIFAVGYLKAHVYKLSVISEQNVPSDWLD